MRIRVLLMGTGLTLLGTVGTFWAGKQLGRHLVAPLRAAAREGEAEPATPPEAVMLQARSDRSAITRQGRRRVYVRFSAHASLRHPRVRGAGLHFMAADGVRVVGLLAGPTTSENGSARIALGELDPGQSVRGWALLEVISTQGSEAPLGRLAVTFEQDGRERLHVGPPLQPVRFVESAQEVKHGLDPHFEHEHKGKGQYRLARVDNRLLSANQRRAPSALGRKGKPRAWVRRTKGPRPPKPVGLDDLGSSDDPLAGFDL